MQARSTALLTAAAVLLAGCGGATSGGTPTVDGPGAAPDADTVVDGVALRGCTPPEGRRRTTVVEPDPAAVPPDDQLEQLLDDPDEPALSEDLRFMVDQQVQDGMSRSAALAEAWIQLQASDVVERASTLPGFVEAAIGSIDRSEPFQLRFRGEAPSLDEYVDLPVVRAVGLDVTSGASGAEDVLPEAYEAARELGISTVSGYQRDDGTVVIEVIAPDAEAVAAWEQRVDDPSVCLVPATTTVPCDADVVAAARAEADPDRPVLPNEQGDGDQAPAPARAEELRRSYLGLTLEEAEAKAVEEGRTVRVTVEEGVELGSTDDLQPGRLSFTMCEGVVVDTLMDLEGTDG